YRLRLIENKGSVHYSDIRMVRIIVPTADIMLFPNPAIDQASLSVKADKAYPEARLRVVNTVGKEMLNQKLKLTKGINNINLPIQSSWPGGIYVVQVNLNGTISSKELVLKRE